MVISNKTKPFSSAKAEVKKLARKAKTAKPRPKAYKLAFMDEDFLLRRALRPVRLQLELLKPELAQQDEHIESTVVIFGSARILEPAKAKHQLTEARKLLKENPIDHELMQQVSIAEQIVQRSHYYTEARKLGNIISRECQKDKKRHFVIVTGGGPGIMEAANRGAYDVGAKSIGHTIVLPGTLTESVPNPYISPELGFLFHYFAIRKMHFLIRARASVFFPGGYGTLDELFETLTLLQTGKIKPIPVLLFGKEYWSRLINFDALVEMGTISPADLRLFQYVETAEEAWHTIADFYQLPRKRT